MMKKAILIISLLFLSGCVSSNETETVAAVQTTVAAPISFSETTIETTSLPEKTPPNYQEIQDKIGSYINHFVTVYSSAYSDDFKTDDKIVKEVIDDPYYGTNGTEITKYLNSKGEIIRCLFRFFGERGQMEENIYVIEDFYFVARLTRYYSAYSVYVGDSDILYMEYDEYIVFDDEYFIIDKINETLVRIDENPISDYVKPYLM